ncbi:MAG: mechanosensitive ion channel family protein [Dysgonomonas sp.]|nr:mechanosensitive ion channel family protein [Dysgonomonas sp.]
MEQYLVQIIVTLVLILSLPIIKYIIRKLIRRYAVLMKKLENRTMQVIRVLSISINLMFVITLIIVWGVDPHNLLVAMSSIFAVIGVALFAQWSMLSNVTAGIIIFFTTPFRIGDYIRILDKDLAFDAHVDDILSFHTILTTREGEVISYPNSLFFQKGVSVVRVSNWDEEPSE